VTADLVEALAAHPSRRSTATRAIEARCCSSPAAPWGPGAAVLAATAALRAGAGRLQIACHPSAVAAHGRAGEVLGRGRPLPGYLPRELLDVLPEVVDDLRRGTAER
jgi:hypothetical protein